MTCRPRKRIRTGCFVVVGALVFVACLPAILMLAAEALFVLAAILE